MSDINIPEPLSPRVIDSEFREAVSAPRTPTKVFVTIALDKEVLDFLRSPAEPANWQHVANGVLRGYMENCIQTAADFDRWLDTVPPEGPTP